MQPAPVDDEATRTLGTSGTFGSHVTLPVWSTRPILKTPNILAPDCALATLLARGGAAPQNPYAEKAPFKISYLKVALPSKEAFANYREVAEVEFGRRLTQPEVFDVLLMRAVAATPAFFL